MASVGGKIGHSAASTAERVVAVRIVTTLIFITFFLSLFVANPAYAQKATATPITQGGYIVTFVNTSNLTPQQRAELFNNSSGPVTPVQFWQLPLWIQISALSSMSGVIAITCLLFVPLVIWRFRKSVSFNKGSVLTYITNNPGCTTPELARDQKMNIGTARYHVHRLEDEGKIVLSRIGKYTRLFVNKSTYDDREKLIASCLRNDTCLGIVSIIMETPGISNQKLSEKLGMEKSLVYRHMQKLLDDKIVTCEWEGKNKLYYISMDAKETLIKLMPLHYQCPGLKKE
jgi:predicted transcriptional regulator